ncbi:MAG TPA: acyl-CoA dehydrogenase family protein, partial [Arenimonas sp.]|nr:acyl-CoA dehydrogenase family protein [Arenimonas sp.]
MNALIQFSPRVLDFQNQLTDFMRNEILPAEAAVTSWQAHSETRWLPCPTIEALKQKAKKAGLWNLFLPDTTHGAGLTNLEYAPLAEQMGRVLWASEVFNCNAPDTGNMEVLAHFATEPQKKQWLTPLLNGEIRSAFAMTEPDVGSSDASNIALRIESDGDNYILNGRKWWITGAGDPRCKILIVMGVTNPDADKYARHS